MSEKSTPEIIQEAVEQVETESRRETEDAVVSTLERILPDGSIEVGGRIAHKLSWARKTILLRAMGVADDADEDQVKGLIADNLDTITVAVYILFEADVAKLYRLCKVDDGIVSEGLVFSEKIDEEDYENMIEYASKKLEEMQDASDIGSNGSSGPSMSTEEGAEKNSAS